MFQSKTKICQNCQKRFRIEPEDFEFYKKIDVPEPTFCPECRMVRRFAFYNTSSLYKRKDDFSKKDIISIYRPGTPYKVYHQKTWYSDKWDPLDYNRDYDFDKPFFEQFRQLMIDIPWSHNTSTGGVNSDYCTACFNCKNCYLAVGNTIEDCLYIDGASNSKNCVDSMFVFDSENCYECVNTENSYKIFFSQYINQCLDSAFLYNCRNLLNCFGCVNLRHKKYHIFNRPYSKEEYYKEIKKYDLGSFNNLLKFKKKFNEFKLQFPRKYAEISYSDNVIGDNCKETKNCYYCFSTTKGVENCKYVLYGGLNLKDSYDILDCGSNAQLFYDTAVSGMSGCYRVFFSIVVIAGSHNISYSMNCSSSNNLFGCIGLRHKKYCILNKQYSKEEYEKLVAKIKKHMDKMPYLDKKGRIYKYGEFFPIEISPFAYNETLAQEYFPLTKKQTLKQGYDWYHRPESKYKPTIKTKNLPDHIKDVNNFILKEVIECAHGNNCQGPGVFRIIPQELKFYKKMNLSLPRLCPACRNRERIKQRNPLKLWQRQCQCAGHKSDNKVYQNEVEHFHKNKPCPNTFQTTYAPDRKEIVYCEECYLKEVG